MSRKKIGLPPACQLEQKENYIKHGVPDRPSSRKEEKSLFEEFQFFSVVGKGERPVTYDDAAYIFYRLPLAWERGDLHAL